jgi:hypothetical protein
MVLPHTAHLTVAITEDCICQGTRSNPLTCPLALALWHQTRASWLIAPPLATQIDVHGKRHPRLLPPEAIAWIRAFDAGEAVEPFTLHLEPGE